MSENCTEKGGEGEGEEYGNRDAIPYILESNLHPNLIHTSFCRFLKRKKS